MPKEAVVQAIDADILYEVPMNLKAQGLDLIMYVSILELEAPEADIDRVAKFIN